MKGGQPDRADFAAVGAGLIGLATARELQSRHPSASVVVLERSASVARGQSSHNSGVVHAGLFYEPGSLKARLCVDGARRLQMYCEKNGVAYEQCGKVIVARDPDEVARLDALELRAQANGAPVRRLSDAQMCDVEPHARRLAGLLSPTTAIVDYPAVAYSLAGDIRANGGTVQLGCDVRRVADEASGVEVSHSRGTLRARFAVVCAGLQSDRLAARSGQPAEPRILPFRGGYFRLRRTELCRGLIYPVPDPRVPLLGVHVTRCIGGDVLVGPTALLSGARRPGGFAAVNGRDLFDTLSWPGTYRMLAQNWRHAAAELRRASSRASYAAEVRTLVPEVANGDLLPSFAGVRAQAVARNGALLDDFVFSTGRRVVHVRNAPSPAATACLAIAGEIADRVRL